MGLIKTNIVGEPAQKKKFEIPPGFRAFDIRYNLSGLGSTGYTCFIVGNPFAAAVINIPDESIPAKSMRILSFGGSYTMAHTNFRDLGANPRSEMRWRSQKSAGDWTGADLTKTKVMQDTPAGDCATPDRILNSWNFPKFYTENVTAFIHSMGFRVDWLEHNVASSTLCSAGNGETRYFALVKSDIILSVDDSVSNVESVREITNIEEL